MAMVTAFKGDIKIKVSRDAYENIFKRQGYRALRESSKNEIPKNSNIEKIDLETIPVSDMNGEQLKAYAKMHDIDISKTKSAAEARKVIQAAIRNENM